MITVLKQIQVLTNRGHLGSNLKITQTVKYLSMRINYINDDCINKRGRVQISKLKIKKHLLNIFSCKTTLHHLLFFSF